MYDGNGKERRRQPEMNNVVQIRGKTEQRVTAILSVLKDARNPLSYDELTARTGAAYDLLLHVLVTLQELGHVERVEEVTGPGRPQIRFKWLKSGNARAMGARKR
jgi:predicted ArsR family transcriptional regulator